MLEKKTHNNQKSMPYSHKIVKKNADGMPNSVDQTAPSGSTLSLPRTTNLMDHYYRCHYQINKALENLCAANFN